MLKGHAADQGAVGEESNMHGGEGKQGVHDVGSSGANSEQSIFIFFFRKRKEKKVNSMFPMGLSHAVSAPPSQRLTWECAGSTR